MIMLEAALVLWAKDTDKARGHVAATITNLRDSVDAIRGQMRTERAAAGGGLVRLEMLLARFEEQHGITCVLERRGVLDGVPAAVWACLAQNLTETLTNVLKHAPEATRLMVELNGSAYLLEAVFCDNGGGGGTAGEHGGMGLASIRERTRLCGGEAGFEQVPQGFKTRMVFKLHT
jgi:signal transduction histidine kinase